MVSKSQKKERAMEAKGGKHSEFLNFPNTNIRTLHGILEYIFLESLHLDWIFRVDLIQESNESHNNAYLFLNHMYMQFNLICLLDPFPIEFQLCFEVKTDYWKGFGTIGDQIFDKCGELSLRSQFLSFLKN